MDRILILFFFILTVAGTATLTAEAAGFSLELIHPFSPRSPFYPGNLTTPQLAQRLVELSRSRISNLKHTILQRQLQVNTTAIRPPLIENQGSYLVVMSIGTDEGRRSYSLVLDTGSGLTWTQCLPCDPCFPQTSTPIFEPNLSPSYHHLSCDDPICIPPIYRCRDGKCKYNITYGDDSNVQGVVSRDDFAFLTLSGGSQSFPNLAFGCTNLSTGLIGFTGFPTGIFGLDAGRESFMTQLRGHTRGRFSYCLLPYGRTDPNYIRFGDDIVMNGPVQRTPLSIINGMYYVDLTGVSIASHNLNIPTEVFARREDGNGGSIVDSGSGYTWLVADAYDVLKRVLVQIFRLLGMFRVDGQSYGLPFEVCYRLPADSFDRVPSVTLHLQGADLRVGPRQLFFLDDVDDVFCLAVKRGDDVTDIGAHQQFNKRFAFDIERSELSFVDDDCHDP